MHYGHKSHCGRWSNHGHNVNYSHFGHRTYFDLSASRPIISNKAIHVAASMTNTDIMDITVITTIMQYSTFKEG